MSTTVMTVAGPAIQDEDGNIWYPALSGTVEPLDEWPWAKFGECFTEVNGVTWRSSDGTWAPVEPSAP